MGDIPTMGEVLRTILAQWDDGGKEVLVEMLTKGDYKDLEDAINTVERIYKKYCNEKEMESCTHAERLLEIIEGKVNTI